MTDATTSGTDDTIDLATHPLFRQLSPETVREMAATMTTASYQAGATIFLEKEPGDALYIIESGTVRIWVHDQDSHPVTLSSLERGAFFGEMAVLTGGHRSANATATSDATLLCLTRGRFEAFLLQHPQAALDMVRAIGERLRQTNLLVSQRVTRNANVVHEQGLSRLDRVALAITTKVGSVGFFLIIAGWTVGWTGYNVLASQVAWLHWRAFDPFPAFVAYLLMSNVIQILLMPLIMVGQNLQSRHSEVRAELDFEINQKAEREVTAMLLHLERNTALLLKLMQHLDVRLTDEELRAIAAETDLARRLSDVKPGGEVAPPAPIDTD
jgi:CRP-like cAMP-binding protein